MSNYQNSLESKLWAIADELRGNMDANEFKNYILGFIFYRYLSEKLEIHMNEELKEDGLTFAEAWEDDDYKEDLKEEGISSLGYFLEPQHLFSNIINKAKVNKFILDDLTKSLNYISNSSLGSESQEDFSNLFEDVDLNSSKLGKGDDKNILISKILLNLNDIDFKLEDDESDILGDAYEYLISQFASSAGKKAGEFYTPQEVSKILAKIVTLGKNKIRNVYDPTCGSGSLLLRVSKEAKISDFCGQELNTTTYNLARMNMILHGVKYADFDIKQGDSLEHPQHMDTKFEAIVANPPFSAKWSPDDSLLVKDERFSAYGKLAPKSKADYAFVQHMIYHLDENGTMGIVLPHGVLFRGAAEGTIRKFLVDEKNYLDAVIGLPANIFYGTSIPTCILVFKKCREDDADILFIDASKGFEKVKNQNKLRAEDIEKIVNTYANREEIEKYSHKATLDEIEENDFNLNIPRYVDTFEEEEPIDLDEVIDELEKIEVEMEKVDAEIKKYCDELGIRAPTSLR